MKKNVQFDLRFLQNCWFTLRGFYATLYYQFIYAIMASEFKFDKNLKILSSKFNKKIQAGVEVSRKITSILLIKSFEDKSISSKTQSYRKAQPFYTICPGSSHQLFIVSYYIKWVTTSWTHSSFYEVNLYKIYLKI